jgi:hypothetical protein
MSIVAIVCLIGIVAAFVLFAAVLAWGDYQTRDINPANRAVIRPPRDTNEAVARLREVTAGVSEPTHAA